jgi:hypothetical protein
MKRLVVAAATRYGVYNRTRKAERLAEIARSVGAQSVLVVGVQPRQNQPFENIIANKMAETVDMFVPSGILAERLDGRSEHSVTWQHYVVADGRGLPFVDNAFDLVVSNAVIEHVGDEPDQQAFVAEHVRVGRHWAMTTPNRWFPIEAHTRVFFKHWRAEWRAQHRRQFTRLLSKGEFAELLPNDADITGSHLSPTFFASSSAPSAASSPRSAVQTIAAAVFALLFVLALGACSDTVSEQSARLTAPAPTEVAESESAADSQAELASSTDESTPEPIAEPVATTAPVAEATTEADETATDTASNEADPAEGESTTSSSAETDATESDDSSDDAADAEEVETEEAAAAEDEAPEADEPEAAPTPEPTPTATPVPEPTVEPTRVPLDAAVAPVPTAGPLPSDDIEITGPQIDEAIPATISDGGALACSSTELAIDFLDLGDVNRMGRTLAEAAGHAQSAAEPDLAALAPVLAAVGTDEAAAFDAIVATLNVCAIHGYQV